MNINKEFMALAGTKINIRTVTWWNYAKTKVHTTCFIWFLVNWMNKFRTRKKFAVWSWKIILKCVSVIVWRQWYDGIGISRHIIDWLLDWGKIKCYPKVDAAWFWTSKNISVYGKWYMPLNGVSFVLIYIRSLL